MDGEVGRLIVDIERARRVTIQIIFAVGVLFVLFEALRGSYLWSKLKGEGNLWNYGCSLVYFTAGQLAIVNGALFRYRERLLRTGRRYIWWTAWILAGIGFSYLACDEMLTIHEKLGARLESAIPVLSEFYPGHADNLIVGVYGAGGVVFSLLFFFRMPVGREARAYLLVALFMLMGATLMDTVPRSLYMRYLPFRESEELLELFSGELFIAAFLSSAAVVVSGILMAVADHDKYTAASRIRVDTRS